MPPTYWVRLHVTSPRDADIVVLNVDGVVERATVSTRAYEAPPLIPEYSDDLADTPFELRFSDPPAEGFEVVLQLADGVLPTMTVSDISVGLGGIEDVTPRPAGVGPAHGRLPADSVVVGRTYHP